MIKYLFTKDAGGKFRYAVIECFEEWNPLAKGFVIQRSYGVVRGKNILSPTIVVDRPKQNRTWKEQYTLQFNSEVKKFIDKGYKEVDKHPNEIPEEKLSEIFGEVKMRLGSTVKPMLAKKESDIKNRKIFDKEWYISRKINGVRCLIYYDGKVKTASRGATNYDLAIIHIISHPLIEEFFKNHPDAILDGEIYKHEPGIYTLNKISGICRTQSTVDDGKDLEFYWYDIVDLKSPFKDRFQTMKEWAKELKLTEFEPSRELDEETLHIQFVPQQVVKGFDNMKKLHDEWVNDGWEGAVIRNPDSVYKPGSRGNDWIKIKVYIDAEYPIKGISEGLREEDMCFILETPSGQQFKCKPMGDRAQKQWYREHIDELIDKKLTIKYFEMSGVEGSDIPQQPIGICIRDYE